MVTENEELWVATKRQGEILLAGKKRKSEEEKYRGSGIFPKVANAFLDYGKLLRFIQILIKENSVFRVGKLLPRKISVFFSFLQQLVGHSQSSR